MWESCYVLFCSVCCFCLFCLLARLCFLLMNSLSESRWEVDTVPCCLAPLGCFWRHTQFRSASGEGQREQTQLWALHKWKKNVDDVTLNSHLQQGIVRSISIIMIKYARKNLMILANIQGSFLVLADLEIENWPWLAAEIVATTVSS